MILCTTGRFALIGCSWLKVLNECCRSLSHQRAGAWLLVAMVALASGCCYCGTSSYDTKADETWDKLQRGLHGGPTPVDVEQTGVTIQLPVVFDSKDTKAFRPGSIVDNEPVSPALLQPMGVKLPGLRFACSMPVVDSQNRKLPVSCYLAVLAKGGAERARVKQVLLDSAKALGPAATWESVSLAGSTLPAERLSINATQKFMPDGMREEKMAVEAEGRLDLYLVAGEHANVLVGWLAPVDVAKRVSFFEAAEASIASIKSEKPATPEASTPTESPATPSGQHVQVPDTGIELIPPANFTLAPAISGFEKAGSSATIVVTKQANPFEATVNSYSDEALRPHNINVLEREQVTAAGGPALLLLLQKPEQTSWNLVVGDDQGSMIIIATLADASDEAEKASLKQALLSTRKVP